MNLSPVSERPYALIGFIERITLSNQYSKALFGLASPAERMPNYTLTAACAFASAVVASLNGGKHPDFPGRHKACALRRAIAESVEAAVLGNRSLDPLSADLLPDLFTVAGPANNPYGLHESCLKFERDRIRWAGSEVADSTSHTWVLESFWKESARVRATLPGPAQSHLRIVREHLSEGLRLANLAWS